MQRFRQASQSQRAPHYSRLSQGGYAPAHLNSPENNTQSKAMLRRNLVRWFGMAPARIAYRQWRRIATDPAQGRIATRLGIPRPDRLNMSWINPQLAVGGRIHSQDIPRLAAYGITHIVDTRIEQCDDPVALGAYGIQLLHLPTPDNHPLTVEQLWRGVEWVIRALSNGERVLIHCEHGVGRSVLLTTATLVGGGASAEDAIKLVQRQRWQAALNQRQIVRLQEFESAIRQGIMDA